MGMSSGKGRGSDAAISDINVTPWVDVMLVLLIIFMVAAPLISQGVPVQLPKTEAQALPGEESKLVLTLTYDKKLFIGTNADNPIPYEQLEEKLRANARLQQDKELFLHADRRLEYGFVIDVMAIVRRAGVENLGMVTDPMGGAAE